MRKDTEIKFVGQPIYGQLLKLIDKGTFAELVREKKSDYYYKAFGSWDQLVLLFIKSVPPIFIKSVPVKK